MPTLLTLLALVALAALPAGEGPAADAPVPTPEPVLLELGRIDTSTKAKFERAISRARETDAPRLVTWITDAGGDPALAAGLIGVALDAQGLELVAVVEGTVTGAASALVLAHDRVVLAPGAVLGAIGAPKDDPGGLSLLRAKARQLAATRERPQAALEAMIGSEDLASHTAPEAIAAGLADTLIEDQDALERELGLAQDPAAAPAAVPGDGASGVAAEESTPAGEQTVAYLKVEGVIDQIQYAYWARALEKAEEQGVDLIVTHIESPGGELGAAVDMLEEALRHTGPDAPRLVAFVDSEAISAAAALAYSHHAIYLTPQAKIGDIGVIFMTSEGMEYAPEKIETFMRAQLRSLADVRGWDRALLSKMTARNQALYEVHLPGGRSEYVIEDDLAAYLRSHPAVDREADVIQILGEDRLLTLTAAEAVEMGMATALVANLEAFYAELGVAPAAVIDLSPNTTEKIAWALSPWSPILIALALMFIMFELKTPGVGIFAGLAGVCGVAFFVSQYYMEMVAYIEVVLIMVGVVLVAIELFTGLTAGILALLGGAMILGGLLLSFMPTDYQFDFDDARWAGALSSAALQSLLSLVVVLLGMLVFVAALPHSRLLRRIAAMGEISGTSDDTSAEGPMRLIGQRGRALDDLHPGGYVEVDGERYSARSDDGGYVPLGSEVEVLRAQFGELVVRRSDADAAQEPT